MKKNMERIAHTLREEKEIPSDVMGSYTGTYHDKEGEYLVPVQDADDL